MAKYLIVGLGNAGAEYANTRHNIGFDVVHAFVTGHDGEFAVQRLAYRAEIKHAGNVFICICPTTFMNLSGRAFKYWLDKEKVPLENTLTIVDDLALPLNRLRIRGSGSNGGHNGLLDIENILGTDEYPKLRFGIGKDFPRGKQSDFVLGQWKAEELPMVRAKIKTCVEVIENFAVMDLPELMTKYNKLEVQADNKNGHTFHF